MQNFVRTKSLRNGEITLSFSLLIKLMQKSRIFLRPKYSFNAIRENKILAKISGLQF